MTNYAETSDEILILLTANCLRLHDNPGIIYPATRGLKFSFLYVDDEYVSSCAHVPNAEIKLAVEDLSISLSRIGYDLQVLHGNTSTVTSIHLSSFSVQPLLVFCDSKIEPYNTVFRELRCKLDESKFSYVTLQDNLVEGSKSAINFRNIDHLYKNQRMTISNDHISSRVIEELLKTRNRYRSPEKLLRELHGESLALHLISEYVQLGEEVFTTKYASSYIDQASSSEHSKSLQRLNPQNSKFLRTASDSFFQGEVLSALLAPLVAMGCVSPRLMSGARDILRPAISHVPLTCWLRREAIRKDWHRALAQISPSVVPQLQKNGQAQLPYEESNSRFQWKVTFRYWKGYVVREGVMPCASKRSDRASAPLIVLVHGFGGSLEHFTSVAQELSAVYDVAALDMMGFGWSEKPPLSYTQYLWRDQVVDFVKRCITELSPTKVVLGGNSIGGFIATSAAAALAQDQIISGLVLLNSAGRILKPQEPVSSAFKNDMFPTYSGPAPVLLRIIGSLIFGLLQPRIASTCAWLYPTNPTAPVAGLNDAILRDSCDPGASDVIAAGGNFHNMYSLEQYLAYLLYVYRRKVAHATHDE